MAVSYFNPPEDLEEGIIPPALLHIWQQQMKESIWHFNQIDGDEAPLNTNCQVWVQPDRDMVAGALYSAYSKIRRYLQYDLQPTWHTERIPFGDGIPLVLESLTTRYKRLKAFGLRATSVILSDAAVVYSKVSTNVINDTATITVPTTVTDVSEIQVFFRVADGAPVAADPRWQIMPVTVTLSGGNAIIKGHRALFVNPLLWNVPYQGVNQDTRNDGQTTNVADFVTMVDVYRVYPDATNAVTFITDPILYQSTGLTQGLTQAGVAFIENTYYGNYRVRLDGICWKYYPEFINVSYLAGCPFSYQDMDNDLQRALIHLANTLMPQIPTQLCDMPLSSFSEDVNVMYKRASGGGGYVTEDECPFGVQIGAQRAWQIVKERGIVYAGKLTGN